MKLGQKFVDRVMASEDEEVSLIGAGNSQFFVVDSKRDLHWLQKQVADLLQTEPTVILRVIKENYSEEETEVLELLDNCNRDPIGWYIGPDANYIALRVADCSGRTQLEVGQMFAEIIKHHELTVTEGLTESTGIPREILFRGQWKIEEDGGRTYVDDLYVVFIEPKEIDTENLDG